MIALYNVKSQGDFKLSNHFKVREFACKGSDYALIDSDLVQMLELVRCKFNKPVHINSGFRTPKHNKDVGGSENSRHLYGMAADIYVEDVSSKDVQKYLESVMPNSGGIGSATTYTHIDTRPIKGRWTY